MNEMVLANNIAPFLVTPVCVHNTKFRREIKNLQYAWSERNF